MLRGERNYVAPTVPAQQGIYMSSRRTLRSANTPYVLTPGSRRDDCCPRWPCRYTQRADRAWDASITIAFTLRTSSVWTPE